MIEFAPILAFTDGDAWHPGIGDPTVMGWVTVVAYFVAAVLCCWVALAARTRAPVEVRRRVCVFWTAFAILMTFLGVNKQLDLQTWLTLFGKHVAKDEGWYAQRRPVQALFILAITIAGSVSLVFLIRLTKRSLRQTWVVVTGGVFLGCFILVRAASFHYMDMFLKSDFGGVRVNWMLELGGIFWIVIGAWLNLRWLKSEAGVPRTSSQTSTPRRS